MRVLLTDEERKRARYHSEYIVSLSQDYTESEVRAAEFLLSLLDEVERLKSDLDRTQISEMNAVLSGQCK
jgi:hypothetical protein